ncbi:MAG TPA: serpin family protein [Pseudonocardiaceae bacterium]|nr:serpin family protein [Pseudonocardiaceae bacterium]
MSAATDTLLDFAVSLHRAIAPDPERNACWSPYSVAVALGMAADAARGPTREELVRALTGAARPDDSGTDASHPAIEHLAELLGAAAEVDPDDAQLALAATAWLREDVEVADGFADVPARWPSGALRSFGKDLREARERINADVADTTRGLIRELLGEGVLGPRTVAVLVSALYLKAAWTNPFDQQLTRSRRFNTPTGAVEVPTMELVAELDYASTERWQFVTLPGRGGVEAVILLPHGPLGAAEAELNAAELSAAPAGSRRVRLRMPRLRLEWSSRLSAPLAVLGVRELFDPDRADLTGLTPQRPAWVDEAVHRSVLRVDEQGLEGAAATAVVIAMRALVTPPAEPLLVAVDRPFLLLIRHRRTGVCYFLTRVTDPS